MNLNVLVISLDYALAADGDDAAGNAKYRQIEYAKYLENLYIVVKAPRNIGRKVKKLKDNLFVYPTSSLNRYFFLYNAYNIASRICKEKRIGLIVTQDPFITGLVGWLLKKKYKIPLNIQIAADMIGNKYFIKEHIFNLFFNQLGKRLIRKADTIRVSTLREKEKLILQGIDKGKIHYVPFFIDSFLFEQWNDGGIRQLNLNGKFEKIVLSMGRLVKQKNVGTLIRAIPHTIKKYPKCLFLIVGAGPEEKRLRKLASDLGVKEFIKFTGQICYKDLPRYFQAADIFVNTSHYEGTCMAIQEAAAARKPIISTPHSGADNVILDADTGLIVDFDDYLVLSKKIIYLLENDSIARDMGHRARSFITGQFKKDDVLKKCYNMWEETIKRDDQGIK